MYKYLDNFKKNEPLYRKILSKIYTAFVNVDASDDINRIKSLVRSLTADILKQKTPEPNGN
jgi:tRNA U54 and U55 pseudouridine synthase Pus10